MEQNFIYYIIICFVIFIIIFLILREVNNWYWKINVRIELQKEANQLQKEANGWLEKMSKYLAAANDSNNSGHPNSSNNQATPNNPFNLGNSSRQNNDEYRKLKRLLDSGAITKTEFEKLKIDLYNSIQGKENEI